MPEGPSIVILKEAVKEFEGRKVEAITGNTKIHLNTFEGKKITAFKSWGKHFLICFKEGTIRIHFMLFGSYRINEVKETPPRLSLQFKEGFINFYACSVKIINEPVDEVYDFTADVMNENFNVAAARKKLKAIPGTLVCDALLDQNIFSGVGNIIKNEVLYRIHVHPKNTVGSLPAKKLTEFIKEAVNYSFDFLKWKQEFTLKKHWLAHTKRICKRCDLPIFKEYLGKTNRRTFYCNNCQIIY